jgi:cell division septal protein FtsQ
LIIIGNNHLNNNEIHAIIKEELGKSKLELNSIDVMERQLKNHSAIKDANVSINSKGKIKIEVTEREPIAYVITADGSLLLCDENNYTF